MLRTWKAQFTTLFHASKKCNESSLCSSVINIYCNTYKKMSEERHSVVDTRHAMAHTYQAQQSPLPSFRTEAFVNLMGFAPIEKRSEGYCVYWEEKPKGFIMKRVIISIIALVFLAVMISWIVLTVLINLEKIKIGLPVDDRLVMFIGSLILFVVFVVVYTYPTYLSFKTITNNNIEVDQMSFTILTAPLFGAMFMSTAVVLFMKKDLLGKVGE